MTAIDNMTIGFWHPFGTHAGESREAIVLRKRAEIQADAWTLLSLQHGKCLDAVARFVACIDSHICSRIALALEIRRQIPRTTTNYTKNDVHTARIRRRFRRDARSRPE
jgi:hypothetical protein